MSDSLIKHYRELLRKHGDNFEAAQYSSQPSQEARYEILLNIADIEGAKVLDFGCGTGNLASYIKRKSITCQYVGVDIVEEFFPYARKKHPEHKFGFLEDHEGQEFDYVFISGVFNNRMSDNEAFFKATVNRLWKTCRRGLAFNLMSKHVDFQDESLWYTSPEDIFTFMKSVTPYISLRNDYVVKDVNVPFEYAIYAYREPIKAYS